MKETLSHASMDSAIVLSLEELAEEDKLAYRPGVAASLVGLSPRTLRREIIRGRLRQSHYGLILRSELVRWLEEGLQQPKLFPVRRRRRAIAAA